jgi:hypothetical protein
MMAGLPGMPDRESADSRLGIREKIQLFRFLSGFRRDGLPRG